MIESIRNWFRSCDHDYVAFETLPRADGPGVIFGYNQDPSDYTPTRVECTKCGDTHKAWSKIDVVLEKGLQPKHEYQTTVNQYE